MVYIEVSILRGPSSTANQGAIAMRIMNLRRSFLASATVLIAVALSSGKTDAPQSSDINILHPCAVIGGEKGMVTIDGRDKKKTVGKRSFAAPVMPGSYDAYSLSSSKPVASLTIDSHQQVYVVNRDEAGAQQMVQDLRYPKTGRSKRKSARLSSCPAVAPGDAENLATINIIKTSSVFGSGKQPITVDGKIKSQEIARSAFAVNIVPGGYDIYAAKRENPVAALSIKPGDAFYIVNSSDAQALRQLGDLLYAKNKPTGAYALYSRSLTIDSTQMDLYKRYADLAIVSAGSKEAIRALRRVVAAGLEDSHIYQTLGDLLLAQNMPQEAQTMYNKAIDLSGKDAKVLSGLAAAKRKSGDLAGAASAYEQAIQLEPDSARFCRALGDIYIAQKDSAKAVDSYRSFLEKGGVDSDVSFIVGAYEFGHRRFKDALSYLVLVKGKQTGKMSYQRMLGESYYQLADYKKALVPLKDAATRYTKSTEWPAVTEMLIKTCLALDDYAKAGLWIEKYVQSARKQSADIAYYRAYLKERNSPAAAKPLYEKNVQRFPSDYRNYLRLGMILSKYGKAAESSVKMLKKAVSLADTIPEAWLEISRLYRKLNKPDEELAALQVFITSNPQNPEANARIGELMMQQGKTAEAMQKLESAGASHTADPQLLKAIAQGYSRSGKIKDAIEALQKAKKSAPDDVRIHEMLIECYQKSNDQAAVRSETKEMLTLRKDPPTLLNYARLCYAAGEFAEATNAIEDIRATDPTNIDALMLLGLVLRAQSRYDEAIQLYQEIMMIDPSYYPALYERAQAHMENKQTLWAETFYNRTLRLDKHHARSLLGLGKIALLKKEYDVYRRQVTFAYKMDPADTLIQREYEASKQLAPGE